MKDGKQATFKTVIEYQIDPTVINAVASAPDPEAAARAVRILIGSGFPPMVMGAGTGTGAGTGAGGGSMAPQEAQPAEAPPRPQGPQFASEQSPRPPSSPATPDGFGFAEPPRTTLEAATDLGRRITADVGEILERNFH